MCGMHGPPVVGKYIEDTQDNDEECSWPLGLEADGNHDASGETNDRDKDTDDVPFALKNEAKEEENEKNTTGKKEAMGC